MKSAILGQVVETPLEYDYLLWLLDCKFVSTPKSLSGYGEKKDKVRVVDIENII